MYELMILNSVVCKTSLGLVGDSDRSAGDPFCQTSVLNVKYYMLLEILLNGCKDTIRRITTIINGISSHIIIEDSS